MRGLMYKGTSKKLKNIVKYRHITYLVLFLIEFTTLILFFAGYIDGSNGSTENSYIALILVEMYPIIGILIASIRFFEPFVFQNFINSINCF